MTDDGSAVSVPVTRPHNQHRSNHPKASGTANKGKHHLASSVLSDSDGVDSPTYDGDIESSTTAGKDGPPHHKASHNTAPVNLHVSPPSTSTTPVVELPNAFNSSKTSSKQAHPIFLTQPLNVPEEPPVPEIAKDAFNPAALTVEDIQGFVRKAMENPGAYTINPPPTDRPVRVYADGENLSVQPMYQLTIPPGVYDLFHFG